MASLLTAFHGYEKLVLALLLSLPRAYAFVTLAGIMSTAAVPRLARNAVIIVLCLPMVPVNLIHAVPAAGSISSLAVYVAKEYALGFFLGWMVGWIFWMITAAGDFIDNQRGAAIASSIDPFQGQETTPLGILFSQAFMTYLYASGGILLIVDILYKSFAIWPVTNMLPIWSPKFPILMLQVVDLGMRTMIVLSAPVVVLMFLSEFALALVSRFAPQVQVFILAMPIKSGIAIFVLIFYIKTLFPLAGSSIPLLPHLVDSLYIALREGALLPFGMGTGISGDR